MTSTYRSAGMSVEAVATRAAKKILPEGVEIFFRLLVLPLGLCFCEQSGGMTKTALPIRFKPAWAGVVLDIIEINCEDCRFCNPRNSQYHYFIFV